MSRKSIAALVKAASKRAGYPTYYALSQAADVSLNTVRSVWLGQSSPSVDTLERIFDAIGWDVLVTVRPAKKRRPRK